MGKPDKQYYELISKAIEEVAARSSKTEECVLTCADIMAMALDDVLEEITDIPIAGIVSTAGQFLYNKIKEKKQTGIPPIPNPWFVVNGHEDRDNQVSQRYLSSRTWKSVGGSALSIAGEIASTATLKVNFADLGIHGNALASTVAHIVCLEAIAKNARYEQSVTIQDWLKLVRQMKVYKKRVRTTSLVGGIFGVSLPTGIATALAKLGIKLTMSTACLSTAAAIHWRAFQEQQLSGGLKPGTGGKIGPASRIYWEIFRRRGVTRLLGQYDIAAMVNEPCGWLPLHDKLMLL